MAILINRDTPILVQGFTGKIATFHSTEMIDYGSNIVGGRDPRERGHKTP